MANGDEDIGLSLSPDLQGYVTGQNELFPPPAAAPTLAASSGFDLAFGDSIATQQHNHGMWGGTGPQYNADNPAPFNIWHTNAVGDPTNRILKRANYLLDQNPDYFYGKRIFLSANANSPADMNSFGQLLDTLKEARAANVVVPGLGPGKPGDILDKAGGQAAVNATIKAMVEKRGFTYFDPNMTRGWDSAQRIHPNYPPEMTSQAMAALAQARQTSAPQGPVPVSEGPYGSANLQPGYQRAPSDLSVSTTPGSQEQQLIAPQQYASAGATDAPTNLLAPASPPLRYNWNPLGAVPSSPLNQPAAPYTAPAAPTPGPSEAPPPTGPGTATLPDVGVTAPANPLAVGLPPVGTDVSHEIWRRGPGASGGRAADQEAADIGNLNRAIYARETDSGRNITVSSAGARGPMQIIPSTFKDNALPGENIDNFDDNMRVGQRLIAKLYRKYGGDMDAVLIGYNAGEKYIGRPFDKLPAETQDYIIKSHRDWGYPDPKAYTPYVPGQAKSAPTGVYMSGDPVEGTNFAIGGRLAFAPPPQMFTGPEAPRPAGSPVASTGQGGGPSGDKDQKNAQIAARTAQIQKDMADQDRRLRGFQLLALASQLARPTIPKNTYDPRAGLPKGPLPGVGTLPVEARIQTQPVGRNVPGSLPYQIR